MNFSFSSQRLNLTTPRHTHSPLQPTLHQLLLLRLGTILLLPVSSLLMQAQDKDQSISPTTPTLPSLPVLVMATTPAFPRLRFLVSVQLQALLLRPPARLASVPHPSLSADSSSRMPLLLEKIRIVSLR